MASPIILVVEDEQAIADMIMASLEMAGFQVKRAANGQIAYQMVDDADDDRARADKTA
jgi:DNA-binding response OmpR family regulator